MLTKRDAKVIDFLEEFKVASSDTLQELFFPSQRVAQRRLAEIVEAGYCNRSRDGFGSSYIYFLKKPKQLRHSLILTDFYREANKIVEIKKFRKEPTLGDIKPDACFGYESNGIKRLACVEVELSNKGFDAEKYNAFDWKPYFPVEPELIIVTDKKLPPVKLKTSVIDTELTNINLIV